jgi:signal transduction histidine kinase
MQRRLLAFFLPIFLLTAAVLGGWLAVESASRISRDAALDRMAEADAVAATVAEGLRRSGPDGAVDGLRATQDSRDERPDVDVDHYLSIDGAPVPPDLRPQGNAIDRIELALDPSTVIFPWTDGDFVTATDIRVEDGASATVTVLEPSDETQAAVARRWVMIAAAVATVMAFIALVTYPLTRWALRPVLQLDRTALALAGGDMEARADPDSGPPEIRRLAASINSMAERVAAGLHRERAFVASASHHFGNLLTPLRLRMETLNHLGTDAGDPLDNTVEEALAELDRLEAAAERLLQLNRAEEGAAQPTVVEVGAIVDESLRSWRVVAEARGVGLERKGSDHALALASPGAIEETLDNLIDNAMKYAEGSTITLSVLRGLHNVRVMVADRGPGLSDAEIEQAQGRFWRGATQQNKPGSGLGLAIVDALAAQCGGHFELRTGPDGGLEAALVLKRAPQ